MRWSGECCCHAAPCDIAVDSRVRACDVLTAGGLTVRYFLTGSSALDLLAPNPSDDNGGWLDDEAWSNVLGLRDFPEFEPFVFALQEDASAFRPVIDAKEPQTALEAILQDEAVTEPLELADWKLTSWRSLVLLRMLRPDKTIPAVQRCVCLCVVPSVSEC